MVSGSRSFEVRASLWQRIKLATARPFAALLRRFIHGAMNVDPDGTAYFVLNSPMIYAAMATLSRLRVFDELRNGPRTSAELAQAVGADEKALLLLLRAVSSVGLLKQRGHRTYALNRVSQRFCSDSPFPAGAWSEMMMDALSPLYPKLPGAVESGESLIKFGTGTTCWEYLLTIPNGTELHDRSMNAWTTRAIDCIAPSYDFSNARTIVDVGGGRGMLLTAILKHAPHLNGICYDRQETHTQATEKIQREGISDRAKHVAGDFLQSVPEGADLYTIKHVLHDWDDESVAVILKNIRAAIPSHGRLLIIEGAVEHDLLLGNSVRETWSLMQYLSTWGKCRTIEEFQELLEGAGFRLNAVNLTPTYDLLILEAVPVTKAE